MACLLAEYYSCYQIMYVKNWTVHQTTKLTVWPINITILSNNTTNNFEVKKYTPPQDLYKRKDQRQHPTCHHVEFDLGISVPHEQGTTTLNQLNVCSAIKHKLFAC